MPSSIINSDDGVISGTSGIKAVGGDDGVLVFQSKGTETARITTTGNMAVGVSSPPTNPRLTLRQAVDDSDGGLFFQAANGTAGGGIAIRNDGGTVFRNGGAEQAKITSAGLFQFNSGYGSVATAYACRAWVNFNGTGTVAIRASGNVSSITDNGTGDYTVNFTTAMPDGNYSYVGAVVDNNNFCQFSDGTMTTSGARCYIRTLASNPIDPSVCCAVIFR